MVTCGVWYTIGEQAMGCTIGAEVGTTIGAQGEVQTVWL